MGEIELKYKVDGEIVSETISYAQKWSELTVPQLLYIANLWESWQLMSRNNVSLLRAKALLFLELLNGNTKFNRKHRAECIAALPEDDQAELIFLTDFIFSSNKLTICPLPWVKVGMRKFYAPNNGLTNIKASEFHFADRFFLKYSDTGNEENLNNFIACIYRSGVSFFDTSGEVRKPFNHKLIDKDAKRLAKLPYATKQLILLWYIGCRAAMVEKYSDLFSSENENKAKGAGWLPLIMAMSGDKFGTFEQTEKVDFILILMELREMKERKPKGA